MTTKISLEQFAKKFDDHKKKDLIEILYLKMSDDDLIEMAEEEEEDEPPACETCTKPVWSNNDVYQKVHDCIVCQDCFDENEKAHKPNYGGRVVPRFNFQFSDGDERGQDIDGQWWVRVKSDKWNWVYEKEQEEEPPEPDGDGSGDE